jgi:hypothetical protein
LKKVLIPAIWLAVSVALANCGSGSSGGKGISGIAYRAFVSNPVGGGINIVNAETDVRATTVGPIAAGTSPSMMVVTPNRADTLVFSGNNNCSPTPPSPPCQYTIINNAKESSAAQVPLQYPTESIVVSPDSSVAYVALPLEKVVEQSQGAIEVISLSNGGASGGQIDVPSVQYLSINNGGDRIWAFSPNSDSIAVVTPSNLGTGNAVVTFVGGFDRPVQAFFSSDDTTAFVINCGAECGGTQASVQQFDMTTNTLAGSVAACAPAVPPNPPQCAGSYGLLNGSTMYLAGTPYMNGQPSQGCTGTAAQTCGLLSIIDLSSMTVTGNAIITDGYHDRMAMGANGQLFVGARTCTEIVPPYPPPPGAEVRGCLTIYNTLTTAEGNVAPGGVVVPPVNGDVTGIQPIGTRDVVYVVQGYAVPGGSLYIYCTTIDSNDNCLTADAAQIPPTNNPTYAPLMVGNFYDVVTVDF